jgi:hypothetical protein
MTEFMGQHRLDFFAVEPAEQGVEEHDPLGAAQAGEVRVAMSRTAAAVHHEEPTRSEAASGQQGFDALARTGPSGIGSNLLNSGAITVG